MSTYANSSTYRTAYSNPYEDNPYKTAPFATQPGQQKPNLEQQIDASLMLVIRVMIVLFMILSGILSLVFAVAIVLVALCGVGLKSMLTFVLTRNETRKAFSLAASPLL